MSYTSGNIGGSYSHNHVYGIRLNAYYGSYVNFKTRNSSGSWNDRNKIGTEDGYFNNSVQASNKKINTDVYSSNATTSNSENKTPYIVVYFWRKIA